MVFLRKPVFHGTDYYGNTGHVRKLTKEEEKAKINYLARTNSIVLFDAYSSWHDEKEAREWAKNCRGELMKCESRCEFDRKYKTMMDQAFGF